MEATIELPDGFVRAVAREMDHEDIANAVDLAALGEYVDGEEIARYVSTSEVASGIDLDDLADCVVDQVTGVIDESEVAERAMESRDFRTALVSQVMQDDNFRASIVSAVVSEVLAHMRRAL